MCIVLFIFNLLCVLIIIIERSSKALLPQLPWSSLLILMGKVRGGDTKYNKLNYVEKFFYDALYIISNIHHSLKGYFD